MAVVRCKLLVQIGEGCGDDDIDAAQEMIGRNAITEAELVEQLPLICRLPPHHDVPRVPVSFNAHGITLRRRPQPGSSTLSALSRDLARRRDGAYRHS